MTPRITSSAGAEQTGLRQKGSVHLGVEASTLSAGSPLRICFRSELGFELLRRVGNFSAAGSSDRGLEVRLDRKTMNRLDWQGPAKDLHPDTMGPYAPGPARSPRMEVRT